jgi:hypothetical protein
MAKVSFGKKQTALAAIGAAAAVTGLVLLIKKAKKNQQGPQQGPGK